jgi:hypothetical protein
MEYPEPYSNEQRRYEEKIGNSHTGTGTIFTGSYYHLDYQPHRESLHTLKCNGVMLIVRKNSDQYCHDFNTCTVYFKDVSYAGIIDWFLGRSIPAAPFQDRLKKAIEELIQKIKTKEEHLAEIEKTAAHVIKCQMKIDKTVSEVVGGEVKRYTQFPGEVKLGRMTMPLTELERQNLQGDNK